MYSPLIIERNLAKLSDSLNVRLQRYSNDTVEELSAHLVKLVRSYDKEGRPYKWTRQPNDQEQAYIDNERVLCKYDFAYWANRYAYIELASIEGKPASGVGRLGSVGFMRPQEVLLEKLAKSEEEMYEAADKGHLVDGLRYFINKGRQLHFTAICRLLSNHRVLFWPDTLAIAASVNEDMTGELYRRDKTLFDNLPWFLKPQVEYDTKNQQLSFHPLGSQTLYHQANQHGGMGQGRMVPVAHMTEVANWDDQVSPGTCQVKLDYHLMAAIPQSLTTLYLLESSSNGLGGWWYDQIQLILRNKSSFNLYFCPWYSADKKYRRYPPDGWEPNEFTKSIAEKAERTSFAYLGHTVRLDKEQLYWYETEIASYEKRLAVFLTNYPTDLTEAFQVWGDHAFGPELLRELRMGVGQLWGPYDITTAA